MAKRTILLLPTVFLAAALWAATPPAEGVTVDQLDHLLLGLHNAGDKNAARDLAGVKLTERASLVQMSRWQAELPGTRSRQALLAVVDDAAFLSPPASEIPQTEAPDAAMQQQILKRVFDYVQRTMPKLPNFLAQRTTTGFDVTTEDHLRGMQDMAGLLQARPKKGFSYQALGPAKLSGLPTGQLYWTGSMTESVSYRAGLEQLEPSGGGSSSTENAHPTLTTQGEFGPILTVILDEAPRDKIVWDRWERGMLGTGSTGTLAVFHFSVPRDRSHFGVTFTVDQIPDFPAYQGEISIDPSDGTVYRITIEAIVRDATSIDKASIMVDFGPAEIGGVNYILPVHAVGLARSYDPFADLDAKPAPIPYLTSINDIAFSGYHVFRAKSRIVAGADGR